MIQLAVTGRIFYGTAILAYGVQQLVYADFRNVQLPAWQAYLPLLPLWAYATGIGLIGAGSALIFGKKVRAVSVVLGGVFLCFFLLVHIPFQMVGEVNSSLHLALWVNALKELALAGGAFALAGSFPENDPTGRPQLFRDFSKLVPFGGIFFSVAMISFGITHFLYGDFVSNLIPDIFPDHLFWTYASGALLIGSGIAIILKIRRGVVAMLLGIMLFLWVFLLHLPRAIAEPFALRGNEVSSMFDALAFCGAALVIGARDLREDLKDLLH